MFVRVLCTGEIEREKDAKGTEGENKGDAVTKALALRMLEYEGV